MSLMLVHPFPPTTPSPPHLSPNHRYQGHHGPLPSPEGCGPSPLMGEYARGRGTQGRPKQWETQAVRFMSLFVLALTTHQHWRRCENEATRRCGGPINNTEGPNDNAEGPMTIRRAHLRCRGPVYDAKDSPTQQRAHQ